MDTDISAQFITWEAQNFLYAWTWNTQSWSYRSQLYTCHNE